MFTCWDECVRVWRYGWRRGGGVGGGGLDRGCQRGRWMKTAACVAHSPIAGQGQVCVERTRAYRGSHCGVAHGVGGGQGQGTEAVGLKRAHGHLRTCRLQRPPPSTPPRTKSKCAEKTQGSAASGRARTAMPCNTRRQSVQHRSSATSSGLACSVRLSTVCPRRSPTTSPCNGGPYRDISRWEPG